MKALLDLRLRRVLRRSGLPDIPENRALARASYWNGFTFGAFRTRRLDKLKAAALAATAEYVRLHPDELR